jgi:lipoprotein-releasing system ATP-binding protein
MNAKPLLIVRELRKAYASPSGKALEVLRGVSFTLAAGEMLAVMGASGAGKSTLLHVLGGLDTADGGSARLGEIELTRVAGAELARMRNEQIGFVFQFHHLLPDLSALENVALPLLVARRKTSEAREAAQAMLAAVNLSARAQHHRPGELSGGEQQRTAIARALVHEPRLILADEPTGNLDAHTGAGIANLLSTLARTRGAGVIVATHNEQLARACDRTLYLKDGVLVEHL